jgi:uncharacterized membrane protein YhaH (DUF805 family)
MAPIQMGRVISKKYSPDRHTAMTPINWALRPLRTFTDFRSRSPRSEYWWYIAMWAVLFGIAQAIDYLTGMSPMPPQPGYVTWALCIFFLLPSVSVSVRRLHDVGRSGWYLLWYLVPLLGTIVVFLELIAAGSYGPNRYGPDPLSSRQQLRI